MREGREFDGQERVSFGGYFGGDQENLQKSRGLPDSMYR